ncbi:ATP-binding protein [Lacinutrix salivirga]
MEYRLFSTNTDTAGYRLDYMEVYNWGTFNEKVWHINPEGHTTLLTGGNGSGKTTFIDALLTLIVPFKKDRFYNQSSGEEQKGARSEESYVLGHYGNKQEEGDLSATKQMLRDETAVSILLASFKNENEKVCTIFQCRWFSNGDLKTQFGLAHKPIKIENDFFPFDTKRKWKERLSNKYPDLGRGNPIEFFNGPGEYGERISRLFGMRSIKALSLFNQVVGIKYVEDLNLFFRKYLLEDKDSLAKSEYQTLANSFNDLTSARNDIEKAEEQMERLSPINTQAEKLEENTIKLQELIQSRATSVYWFANREKELCEDEQNRLKILIDNYDTKIDSVKKEIDAQKDKEAELKVDYNNIEPARQIKALESEIDTLKGQRQERVKNNEEYNHLAKDLDFKENPTEKLFTTQRTTAADKMKNCDLLEKEISKKIGQNTSDSDKLREEIEQTKENIANLRKNNNNIPRNVSRIREDIIKAVGATKKEIPFIGELITVNEAHLDWEKGIEKLLHSFALRIIVPERYYREVNKYVNKTNLRGKIFYQRYKETDTLLDVLSADNPKGVFQKIDFKMDSVYVSWLKEQIYEKFNFYCADDLQDFDNSKRALTKEGLIKFGGGRHQKDDSRNSTDRSNYVLGWDNSAKIGLLREQLRLLSKSETDILEYIGQLETQYENNKTQRDNFFTFSTIYQNFDGINWQKYAENIQAKTNKIEEIANSNDTLKTLKSQLERIKKTIDEKEDALDEIKEEKGTAKRDKISAERRDTENGKILRTFENINIDTSQFEKLHPQILDATYNTIQKFQSEIQKEVNETISKLESSKNDLEKDIRGLMQDFILPGVEVESKFPSWRADTNGLKVKIELVNAYIERYKDLKDENLPQFKTEFDSLLKQTIFQNVEKFKAFFNTWKEEIESTIESLNKALEGIVFKTIPSETYLQLKADYKTTKSIDEFKLLLRNATPNFREHDTLERKKKHFDENINPLVERLNDETWRSGVMDVRKWFEYKTTEYYKSSNKQTNTVTSMAGLSGGEKASLTYTVLGSAIAYQFGLTSNNYNNNSFRFIAIDEAFKGQDPDHAEFLMKLCKQLKLQLLVVTPSDKMKIVQPYISYIHLIEKQKERDSVIRNMPIYTYQELEKNSKNL